MTSRLFGTDGMRGVALEPPLDRPTLSRLGLALYLHLEAAGKPTSVLLAGDSRGSTETLAGWLGGSFIEAGGSVAWAGVMPTPAVSQLLRDAGSFGAGVVISASHNPASDNGVKLMNGGGAKWAIGDECALEDRLAVTAEPDRLAPLPAADPAFARRYLELITGSLAPGALAGMSLIVDAAHGAAVPVAEQFFSRLGAAVRVINAAPDGTNINDGCGALHPEALAAEVVAARADAGVAFDGDADRAILVTGTGRILDGDDVLLVWGRALADRDRLPGRTVVATVMSNLGLEAGLGRHSISVVRCSVGDREVAAAMRAAGAALGGEQSGHVICAHHSATGDGMLTAAHVLAIAREQGSTLEALADLVHFPQVLRNVRVGRKLPIEQVPVLATAIDEEQRGLGAQGRVLVRYSGTEPLLRVMVEAPTLESAESTARRLADLASEQLAVNA